MNRASHTRRPALLCLLLSAAVSLVWALSIVRTSSSAMVDFKAYYYGARCLIRHHDPYAPSVFLNQYRADGGTFPTDPVKAQALLRAMPVCINLPTSLLFVSPLAKLPWASASILWILFESLCLTFAGFFAWDLTLLLAGQEAHNIFLAFVCILLANNELLLACGNMAAVVVTLCVVSIWCFFKQRYTTAGVVCLAMGLVLKPHDAGFVWLFLLLTRGQFRRHAVQTLMVALVLSLPAVICVSHAAPHWIPELHSNLIATSAHGDINDPGPTSLSAHLAGSILDLQSVISLLRDDPHIYNPLSYLICGALLLVGSIATLTFRFSIHQAAFAIAAIVPLSLLITYHRPYDARLLLLTLPACAILWTSHGRTGRFALAITTAAIALTGDLVLAILSIFTRSLAPAPTSLAALAQSLLLLHASTLALLLMAVFYLCIYIRSSSGIHVPLSQKLVAY